MSYTIKIDPVTRIEGHARVNLNVADDGTLSSAILVVKEIRGFERILVGMDASRMPLITNRICGVCPSAHHLAASKALDAIAGVEPPPAGKMLRELLYMGHVIHSHSLSLFVLHGPDLLLGDDVDPAHHNVVGMAEAAPEVARKALRLRSLGQKINEKVGGRGIHPVTSVAGGITFKLDAESKRVLESWTDEALELTLELSGLMDQKLTEKMEKAGMNDSRWSTPSSSLGTLKNGKVNFYDGNLHVTDENGNRSAPFDVSEYKNHLVEKGVASTYMKSVFLKRGDQLIPYRVGPLARLNVAEGMETPLAQQAFEKFRARFGDVCHNAVLQIGARLVELLYVCEKAKQLISSPEITGEARVPVKVRAGTGVGHVEAPRGTLIHEYKVNEEGVVQSANLIVATQQNSELINETIKGAAAPFLNKGNDKALLDAVEFAVRCYDPCLSCATHALGEMPMEIEIRRQQELIRTVRRNVR